MCVIIVNKEGKKLPNGVIAKSMAMNPDGFGIAYLDGKKEIVKTMDYTEAFGHVQSGRPYVAHFRYTTRGATNVDNCHPFTSGNGSMFHNGTVNIATEDDQVDSAAIAKLVGNMNEEQRRAVLELTDSRFVRVTKGAIEIYNEKKFVNHHGVLYSKNNVLSGTLVAVYGTLRKGYSNHHLLRNADFVGYGHTFDKYRMTGSSIPFLLQGKNAKGGSNVRVEVYAVNSWQLKSLDQLEGHPTWYRREKIGIRLDNDLVIGAETYIINDVSKHDEGTYYADFEEMRPKTRYGFSRTAYGGSLTPYGGSWSNEYYDSADFGDSTWSKPSASADEQGDDCPTCSSPTERDEFADADWCHNCGGYVISEDETLCSE